MESGFNERTAAVGYRGQRRVSLLKVAKIQKTLIWMILLQMLLYASQIAVAIFGVASRANFGWVFAGIFSLLFVGIWVVCVVQAVRLAHISGTNIVIAVLVGIFMIVPLLGLLLIAAANGRATRLLQKHGVRVGFMGVTAEEMNKLVMGACRGCGYDLRGLTGTVCPECGTPLEQQPPPLPAEA
jgi:hypothetical protein